MRKFLLALFATLLFLTPASAQQYALTGEVVQEIVGCSTATNSTALPAFKDATLAVSITPQHADSVIKITFDVPRADVSEVTGSHSERTMAVRVFNATDGVVVGPSVILGRVLTSLSSAAATSTGGLHAVRYYEVDSVAQRTFRLEYRPGIEYKTRAYMRGDRGAFCIILQEMRPAPAS